MEIFKKINGFDYEVSNYGNVKSINRTIVRSNGKRLTIYGRVLKKRISRFGYVRYVLYKNKVQFGFLAHRLVAEHFIENNHNYPQVNHKDENKRNNHHTNLEWCSVLYNLNYGSRNDNISKRLNKKVIYIKNGISTCFDSVNDASISTGYSTAYISMCCNNKRTPKRFKFIFN